MIEVNSMIIRKTFEILRSSYYVMWKILYDPILCIDLIYALYVIWYHFLISCKTNKTQS